MSDGSRMLRFTLQKFPATGDLKDACGLPFACVAQPFARSRLAPLDAPCELKAKEIARCTDCYAYINRYCQLERAGWSCALCGQYNEHLSFHEAKYGRQSAVHRLPELRADFVEMECDPCEGLDDSDSDDDESVTASQLEQPAVPVYLALVDVCCGEDTLELMRSALQAALEALPPAARFGLITYSQRLGLYEVGPGGSASVRYVQLLDDDTAPTALELEDALPLAALLTPVGQAKESIVAALDALQAEPFDPPSKGEPEQLRGGRAFGAAVQAVLRYLSGAASLQREAGSRAAAAGPEAAAANGTASSVAGSYAGARLLAFVAGPPDAGRGRVFHRRPRRQDPEAAGPTASTIIMDPMMSDLNPYTFSMPAVPPSRLADAEDDGPQPIEIDPEAREFYEEAAAAAASLAVCIDLFAVSEEGCGLAAVEPLAAATGGALFLYPSADDAALPQDIYRRLGSPLARGGLLRLRTSPDVRIARAFGHLFPDDQFENLFHVISADPGDCFAFDLEYAKASGLNNMEGMAPVLQMVFQYSVLVPQPEAQKTGVDTAASPQRFVLQRRMRVVTVPVAIAVTPREVFDGCDADAVLAVLLHKLVEAAGKDGAAEGHALLRDWLAILAGQYNQYILGLAADTAVQADVAFEAVEALQPVPRLTYGLLRSPLLVRRPDDHPDSATAARLLWAGLPPGELRRAVFPLLSSYSSPDAQAFPQHSLSEAALTTSGQPIFLLDTHTEVVVYYAPGAQEQPFPPPQGSLLRNAINAARAGRRMTPRLRLLRSGAAPDHDRMFHARLIEEPDAGLAAAGAEAGRGFVLFLDSLKASVVELLQRQTHD